jgi:hypothetical protein
MTILTDDEMTDLSTDKMEEICASLSVRRECGNHSKYEEERERESERRGSRRGSK